MAKRGAKKPPRAQLVAALQWLLDDMHTAGETHDNVRGDIFDSVEEAAATLVEAGGNLNWYSTADAQAYRRREAGAR